MQKLSPLRKLLSILFRVFMLYWASLSFIAISIIILLLIPALQLFAVHTVAIQPYFLPLFASIHHPVKVIIHTTFELIKQIPLFVIILVRHKYFQSQYVYLYTACLASYILHINDWFLEPFCFVEMLKVMLVPEHLIFAV